MNSNLDPSALARTIVQDRVREAEHDRLVRECRPAERAVTARTAARSPRRHSRVWSLVHFRQAYS